MTELWERQPYEAVQAFHAFTHYRDLGPARSFDKAWAEHVERCLAGQTRSTKGAPGRWTGWTQQWDWVRRTDGWDAHNDRIKREAQTKELEEMAKRHATQAQSSLQVLSLPVAALAKKLRENPDLVDQLAASDSLALINLAANVGRVLPQVVNMERQARGMATQIAEVQGSEDRPIRVVVEYEDDWQAD